jgi:hypothetical protein
VIESKRDKIWGGRVLAFSSLCELVGCREAGGAFSLSADWEEPTVFWLEMLPGCEAALTCEGAACWGEEGGCEDDVQCMVGLGKSLYAI